MREILFMSAVMVVLALAGTARGDATARAMLDTPPVLPDGWITD